MSDEPFRYWTWNEIQRFVLDNFLAIATGLDGKDDVVLTGRGEELLRLLAATRQLGGGVP